MKESEGRLTFRDSRRISLELRFYTNNSGGAGVATRTCFYRCTLKDDKKVMDYFNRLSEIRQQLSRSTAETNDYTSLHHISRKFRHVSKFQMTNGFLQDEMGAGSLTPGAAMNKAESAEQCTNKVESAEQMHDEDNFCTDNIGNILIPRQLQRDCPALDVVSMAAAVVAVVVVEPWQRWNSHRKDNGNSWKQEPPWTRVTNQS